MTRLDKLQSARLYFVCEAGNDLRDLDALLDSALAGGVDVIQLRDKDAEEERILEAAPHYRAAADRHDSLFFLNDRPDLVEACAADGIHVGQDDASVSEARDLAGSDALVGLSTHRPEQLAAARSATGADRPDYVSVGPVWATPTKPGRPAAGIDYVTHAAATEEAPPLPWFAIGGIDLGNVAEVRGAGASRIVVVRAIRDAADPEGAATTLRQAVVANEEVGAR